jgi:serine/threonine protein kinase
MKQELWRKVEELFHAALERTPVERQAFLDGICGADTDLRREVELMLAKGEQAGSFLEVPAIGNLPVTLREAGSLVGRQFGTYHIVSQLGAGGMGEVYRAHDSKLDRDVAVKTLPQEFARDYRVSGEKRARWHPLTTPTLPRFMDWRSPRRRIISSWNSWRGKRSVVRCQFARRSTEHAKWRRHSKQRTKKELFTAT